MKAGSGNHFEQADNAPAAVDEAMLIVGQRVSDAPNDKEQLVPSVAAISPVVAAQVQAVLVDRGFYSAAAVQSVEQKPGGSASGVTVYAAVEKHSHRAKTPGAALGAAGRSCERGRPRCFFIRRPGRYHSQATKTASKVRQAARMNP